MYSFLQNTGETDEGFVQLWAVKNSLKVKIFIWLVLKRRVLTMDILLKRGWSGTDIYVFCSCTAETADHLFVACEVSSSLLESLFPNKILVCNCRPVEKLWESSKRKQGALRRKELATIAASWWTIWLEQNRRHFENKRHCPRLLLANIRSLRADWNSFCT